MIIIILIIIVDYLLVIVASKIRSFHYIVLRMIWLYMIDFQCFWFYKTFFIGWFIMNWANSWASLSFILLLNFEVLADMLLKPWPPLFVESSDLNPRVWIPEPSFFIEALDWFSSILGARESWIYPMVPGETPDRCSVESIALAFVLSMIIIWALSLPAEAAK